MITYFSLYILIISPSLRIFPRLRCAARPWLDAVVLRAQKRLPEEPLVLFDPGPVQEGRSRDLSS